MSREILALGGFAGALVGYTLVCGIGWAQHAGMIDVSEGEQAWLGAARLLLLAGGFLFGLLGLYCSARLYSETGRPFWSLPRTALRFASTAAWLGLAIGNLAIAAAMPSDRLGAPGVLIPLLLLVLTLAKIEWETGRLVNSDDRAEDTVLRRSRRLLAKDLLEAANRRRSVLVTAGLLLPAVQIGLVLGGAGSGPIALVALFVLTLGLYTEILERGLFFRAEAMPAMPIGR